MNTLYKMTMKKICPLCVLLIIASAAFGQLQKPPKGISVGYDKFRDETEITTAYMYTGVRDQTIWFEHKFTGQTLKGDVEKFVMVITDKCGGRYCFHDFDAEIIFLIDGERSKKNDPDFGSPSDIITFDLTRGELEKMGNAKTVEFQVARRDGAIRSKDLAILKSLLAFTTVKK